MNLSGLLPGIDSCHMPERTQLEFLRSLRNQIASKLKVAGLTELMVNTFEEAGEPRVKLSGEMQQLGMAKVILRSYDSMLVLEPKEPQPPV
ncbi:MAG: hypothetical protein JWM68_926 [Verrucomicrobiales bacterium]|nr:hypothetical protein [Verrucomicrobiales bacterium]